MLLRNPEQFNAALLDQPGTVFLDDRAAGRNYGICYLLAAPVEIIAAQAAGDVPGALRRLDEHLRSGRFAAGYIAYDAGLGWDKPLRSRHSPGLPLVWLGVYDQCWAFAAEQIDFAARDLAADIAKVRLNIAEDEYLAAAERVKQYIAAGDVYQINYTCKLRFEHRGRPRDLFGRLRRAHPVCHSAWINTGTRQVMSLSPELFLRRDGREVRTRPMKGTVHRGRWSEEDESLVKALPCDEKNRAENVMIVDLMRNDLGRLCRRGTIRVSNALAVERYRSLLQMTSEVAGSLPEGTTSAELLRATFPPGSVTGAPKLRAMEIIDELEHEARGIYCGAIGLFRPSGDCLLNVAIRTIVQQGDECELGVGSGIVADSEPSAELAEIRLKGHFLAAKPTSFALLETIGIVPGRPPAFLEEHLRRMRRSARYFGRDFSAARLLATVAAAAAKATDHCRMRLLLAEDGKITVECSPLPPRREGPATVLLSERRTDPADIFLYHKTTLRDAYDADLQHAQNCGCFDAVYCNLRGEITEGAMTNLLAEIDGRWYTPPLPCGLLPGIWRAAKIAQGYVTERTITLDDLLRATHIVLGNSVRGDVQVHAIVAPGRPKPIWRRRATGLPSE